MERNAIFVFSGVAILSLILALMAWFPGAFIYRCTFVYGKVEIVRPMEWIAFLFPLLSLIGLVVTTLLFPSWIQKSAIWILPLLLLANFTIQAIKVGWFFGGWGGGGFG